MPTIIERETTHLVRYDLSTDGAFEHIANDCDRYHRAGFNLYTTLQHNEHVIAIFQKRDALDAQ